MQEDNKVVSWGFKISPRKKYRTQRYKALKYYFG